MYYTPDSINSLSQDLKSQDKTIVLATGFFDLLHQEHRNFLSKAKSAGDVLIVGIESDARARLIKGEGRPRETQQLRAQHVAPLADYIILLPDDFSDPQQHETLIANTRPDVLAVSSHTSHQLEKQALLSKYGGELRIVHQHNPSISTTNKLKSA